jgi:hypothetical protein
MLPREQLLMHFVPPDQLHQMWQTIQETVEQPGLQQFKNVTLLLHAKNLKTQTKDWTWAGMMTRFRKCWWSMADEAYSSADFYYDIGKEVFAAGNQYPFTNTAIEMLALDPQLRKTWQHVGAGLSHDPVALIKAYLYAKASWYAARYRPSIPLF